MHPAITLVSVLICTLFCSSHVCLATPTELRQTPEGWTLVREGKPYVVRGVGGQEHLELARDHGANALRTWGSREDLKPLLDRAEALGMTVMMGLWVGHEAHGFDYADQSRLDEQFERFRATVRRYRDHPALLCWGVGNEMEQRSPDPARVLREVNRIAAMVKAEDPDHPTVTVLAEAGKVKLFMELCPDVDILGINSYGGLSTLPARLERMGYTGPLLVTEFGPLGEWEAPKTAWGEPIEETSSEKADRYLRHYRGSIEGRPQVLGSFVFKWGHKQETTSTWFSMFLPTGEKLGPVDAMSVAWRGREPDNRSPRLSRIALNVDPAAVLAGGRVTARADVNDPDDDALTYQWKLRSESRDRRQGGEAEAVPPTHWTRATGEPVIEFTLPDTPGAYRLFLTVLDGRGSAATSNLSLLASKADDTSQP